MIFWDVHWGWLTRVGPPVGVCPWHDDHEIVPHWRPQVLVDNSDRTVSMKKNVQLVLLLHGQLLGSCPAWVLHQCYRHGEDLRSRLLWSVCWRVVVMSYTYYIHRLDQIAIVFDIICIYLESRIYWYGVEIWNISFWCSAFWATKSRDAAWFRPAAMGDFNKVAWYQQSHCLLPGQSVLQPTVARCLAMKDYHKMQWNWVKLRTNIRKCGD